jgi:hypothetical protein
LTSALPRQDRSSRGALHLDCARWRWILSLLELSELVLLTSLVRVLHFN